MGFLFAHPYYQHDYLAKASTNFKHFTFPQYNNSSISLLQKMKHALVNIHRAHDKNQKRTQLVELFVITNKCLHDKR